MRRGGVVRCGLSGTGSCHERGGEVIGKRGQAVREHQVLALYVDGFTYKEIGGTLGIATSTVGEYLERVRARYGVTARRDLNRIAQSLRWDADDRTPARIDVEALASEIREARQPQPEMPYDPDAGRKIVVPFDPTNPDHIALKAAAS